MRDIDLFINNNKVVPSITGNTIDGIEVLAQRVTVVLQTRVSDVLREQEGCSFMAMFGASQADATYVYLMLSSVASEVVSVMSSDNDDEYGLHSIDVSNITVEGDVVTFDLNVTSKAGNTYTTKTTIGGII